MPTQALIVYHFPQTAEGENTLKSDVLTQEDAGQIRAGGTNSNLIFLLEVGVLPCAYL